jgi:hypothetical protein
MARVYFPDQAYGEGTEGLEAIQRQAQWLMDVVEHQALAEHTSFLLYLSAALYALTIEMHHTLRTYPAQPPAPYYPDAFPDEEQ